jgi:hypothetical protein
MYLPPTVIWYTDDIVFQKFDYPGPVPLKALVLEAGILAVAADPTVGSQAEGTVFLLAEAQPGANYAARHPNSATSRRFNSAGGRPDSGARCRDSVACRRCLSNVFSINRLVFRLHTLQSEIMVGEVLFFINMEICSSIEVVKRSH